MPTRLGLVLVTLAVMPAVWPASAAAAPPNDNFASAQALDGSPASAQSTSVDATKEPGERDHAGNTGGASVWFRWTAPADGSVTIDTCASDFDTVLAVYTGADVGSLAEVASNDDACAVQSSVAFLATAGQVYSIAVDGFSGETGTVVLSLQPGGGGQAFDVTASAEHVERRGRVDGTKFVVDSSLDLTGALLELVSGNRTIRRGLLIRDEGRVLDDKSVEYTLPWACRRAGTWRWTITARAESDSGAVQTRVFEGTLEIARCRTEPWFVSAGTAERKIDRDFNLPGRVDVDCNAVGRRRGSRSDAWRCRLSVPGLTCRGTFLIRARRKLQGSDVLWQRLRGSGGAECVG